MSVHSMYMFMDCQMYTYCHKHVNTMSVHGIDMYITQYVHTMSVRVYDMFVIFGFGIYMSTTHIVKFTNMSESATCLSPSIGQGCR